MRKRNTILALSSPLVCSDIRSVTNRPSQPGRARTVPDLITARSMGPMEIRRHARCPIKCNRGISGMRNMPAIVTTVS